MIMKIQAISLLLCIGAALGECKTLALPGVNCRSATRLPNATAVLAFEG
jgi:hypothetical protein